ncbi:Uncharacterised protein [Mycobacterium tuberculosis]|uniref:Uncharacterized protein n=1 Tax=Mycobacterium tuberculosis TaxID=1773 RepID=A0A0T7LF39_MYCTX|nr:Uncharacterised protein [Mycobacterium tuberculosis]CFR93204.1 Uncharacterised protein [Mycobacterium tuberculosis]CFS58761.1 Uncharacterised protein [Mycobacterium tuberculosis]CKR53294.1 Uncharacterised protein [Mycobacterium tuberculosis]CKT82648.1 Uncharacterised protein [Mycobacterium tuberculosis]
MTSSVCPGAFNQLAICGSTVASRGSTVQPRFAFFGPSP